MKEGMNKMRYILNKEVVILKKLNIYFDMNVSILYILHRSDCCAGYMLKTSKMMCVGESYLFYQLN